MRFRSSTLGVIPPKAFIGKLTIPKIQFGKKFSDDNIDVKDQVMYIALFDVINDKLDSYNTTSIYITRVEKLPLAFKTLFDK